MTRAEGLEGVSGIYVIHNAVRGHFYIGSSSNVAARWRQHVYDLKRGTHINSRLLRAWRKDGAEAWGFTVIALVPAADMHATETRLLARLVGHPACYNVERVGGGGRLGLPHSAATKAKISASQRGKRHSPVTRAKMSAARKGRKMVYRNGVDPRIGRKLNEEQLKAARERQRLATARGHAGLFKKGHKYHPRKSRDA